MSVAFPWLLSIVLFFAAVRHVITWAWLPWIIIAALVSLLVFMINLMGGMFKR